MTIVLPGKKDNQYLSLGLSITDLEHTHGWPVGIGVMPMRKAGPQIFVL